MNGVPTEVMVVIVILLIAAVLATLAIFVALLRPWLRAFLSGTPVTAIRILAMRLRGNPPDLLVDAYGTLKRGGSSVSIDELETAYMDARSRVATAEDLVQVIRKRETTG
jgi:uncharacterized protein YqfA (UPF0365 family)